MSATVTVTEPCRHALSPLQLHPIIAAVLSQGLSCVETTRDRLVHVMDGV